MNGKQCLSLADRLERELLDDVIPFWLEHGMDREHDGILTGLDRDGTVIETDKSVWFQGRTAWMLSRLYEHSRDPKHLEAASSCIRFLINHCFDTDGRMFFRVDREGRPLIRRRYLFSETFAVIAFAAYGRASGETEYVLRAGGLAERILVWSGTPGYLEPKWNPRTRVLHGFAFPMIMISTLQELRRADPSNTARWTGLIDGYVGEIAARFVNRGTSSVLETVGEDGPLLDHFEGRMINPGHSMEASWFILREGMLRGNREYRDLALEILGWMWDRGWDAEYGGVYYFRDALGLPPVEYWHDMKFWWPQCEAILANLLAWRATGDSGYFDRFGTVLDWAESRLRDRERGEWFGYLHRDGSVSSTVKGNMFKGPFHIPRMLLFSSMMLRGEPLD